MASVNQKLCKQIVFLNSSKATYELIVLVGSGSFFLIYWWKQRGHLFVDLSLWTELWSFKQSDMLFGSQLCKAFKKQDIKVSAKRKKERVWGGQDRCDVFIVFCPSQHSGRGIQHKLFSVYCLLLVDRWKLH